VAVRTVQQTLLNQKSYLMPFLDITPDDPNWEAVQRIGVTGILEGVGKSEAWNNKLFFYADSLISEKTLLQGLTRFYETKTVPPAIVEKVTVAKVVSLLTPFLSKEQKTLQEANIQKTWERLHLKNYNPDRPVTRYEVAVLIDDLLHPFQHPVHFDGTRIR
jgi:hypothetical protein